MEKELFTDFSPVSAKQWKQKIQVDLKGAEYNETLLTSTNEGIDIKPFYHQDDFKKLTAIGEIPTAKICQRIFVSNEQTANKLALDALKRGADIISFEANAVFDIDLLLDNIDAEVNLIIQFYSRTFLDELLQKIDTIKVNILYDCIGNFANSGNWQVSQQEDLKDLKSLILKSSDDNNVGWVQANHYQNAGANIVQQVAYALAHGNEYLHEFANELNKGVLHFSFAIGGNYFMEIAKLRAFRSLWSVICSNYEVDCECKINAEPSIRNKTLYDYNVNMLRTTTECMSAILGGADMVSNLAYDSIYHKKNEFGERIARNQLIILKEESYFNEAKNSADGAYYIESLTLEIAQKALAIFKGIEKSGGFINQLNAGTIQRKIEESAAVEQCQFDEGKIVLLGTNKHPNKNDSMKDNLELYPFLKVKPRKTNIIPILTKRLSEKLEKERLKSEEKSN